MTDWGQMSPAEKAARVGCTLTLAAKLVECIRREDVLGAAVCGLSAVAALGFSTDDIRAVLFSLERQAGGANQWET